MLYSFSLKYQAKYGTANIAVAIYHAKHFVPGGFAPVWCYHTQSGTGARNYIVSLSLVVVTNIFFLRCLSPFYAEAGEGGRLV